MIKKRFAPKPAPLDSDGFWANMDTLKLIRKRIPNFRDPLGIYVTLCLIMSDEKSRTFKATTAYIGYLSGGLSRQCTLKALARLESIGVIAIDRASLRQIGRASCRDRV